MDLNEHIYQVVCRLEDKIDRHIAEESNHITRGELVVWFTVIGGAVGLALGAAV